MSPLGKWVAKSPLKEVNLSTKALLILILLSVYWLGFISIRYSIAEPLCCGDDGAIALVAKSLSEGRGYALPINFSGESGKFYFDPGISTGPTLVIPAAIMLRILGDHPWVPGFTSAVVSLGLIIWVCMLALRSFGIRQGAKYGLLAIVSVYFVTSGQNFIHWHALVGEIPAALLTVCAAFYVIRDEGSTYSRFLPGILLGLAVQSKLLASLAFPVFALFSLWGERGLARRKRDWLALISFCAGFLTPIIIFELWRLRDLGVHGYVTWFSELRAFMKSQVPGVNLYGDRVSEIINRAASNSKSALSAYGHGSLDMAAFAILVSLIGWKFCDRISGKFALCIALVAATHLAWWTLFSNGWQRYELIGEVVAACTLATTALWVVDFPIKMAAIILSLVTSLPTSNPSQLAWFLRGPSSLESIREENLRAVIMPIANRPQHTVIVGGWWASLVEAKFLVPENVSIVAFNQLSSVRASNVDDYLLINHKWDNFAGLDKNPSYQAFKRKCPNLITMNADFELYKCSNTDSQ